MHHVKLSIVQWTHKHQKCARSTCKYSNGLFNNGSVLEVVAGSLKRSTQRPFVGRSKVYCTHAVSIEGWIQAPSPPTNYLSHWCNLKLSGVAYGKTFLWEGVCRCVYLAARWNPFPPGLYNVDVSEIVVEMNNIMVQNRQPKKKTGKKDRFHHFWFKECAGECNYIISCVVGNCFPAVAVTQTQLDCGCFRNVSKRWNKCSMADTFFSWCFWGHGSTGQKKKKKRKHLHFLSSLFQDTGSSGNRPKIPSIQKTLGVLWR